MLEANEVFRCQVSGVKMEPRGSWILTPHIMLRMKLRLPGTMKRRERRTSNVQHRTSNIDDATLYRFYTKRIAEYW